MKHYKLGSFIKIRVSDLTGSPYSISLSRKIHSIYNIVFPVLVAVIKLTMYILFLEYRMEKSKISLDCVVYT